MLFGSFGRFRRSDMKHNVFVGSLPLSMTEDDLKKMVKEFGTIKSVKIITDKETGRSRGFAFIEMGKKEEAAEAIKNINGKELEGLKLWANWARRGEKGKFESRDWKRR